MMGRTVQRALTSPLWGEVAAKRRVGVILSPSKMKMTGGFDARVTPPRSCAPTLPLKGRVEGGSL